MKTTFTAIRLATLVTTLSVLGTLSAAASTGDSAARQLASTGSVSVQNVGPYVELGTFRVQVSSKLGRPDVVLTDGTWLYHHRAIEGSTAKGTLIVRFASGRVTDLTVATPAVVAALRTAPLQKPNPDLVASK